MIVIKLRTGSGIPKNLLMNYSLHFKIIYLPTCVQHLGSLGRTEACLIRTKWMNYSKNDWRSVLETLHTCTGFCLGNVEWWSKFNLQDTSLG